MGCHGAPIRNHKTPVVSLRNARVPRSASPEARHQQQVTSSASPAARHQQRVTRGAPPAASATTTAPSAARHQHRVTSSAPPAARHQQQSTAPATRHQQRVASAPPTRDVATEGGPAARAQWGFDFRDLATRDRDLARGRAQLDSPHHRDMRCSTCAHNHRVCTLQWCSLQHTTGAPHPKTSPGRAFAWVHPGGRCLPQPGAQVARECANG